jgi:hypothetical protein
MMAEPGVSIGHDRLSLTRSGRSDQRQDADLTRFDGLVCLGQQQT